MVMQKGNQDNTNTSRSTTRTFRYFKDDKNQFKDAPRLNSVFDTNQQTKDSNERRSTGDVSLDPGEEVVGSFDDDTLSYLKVTPR